MKLKVLFLRKKYIYYFVLVLLICMFFAFSVLSDNNVASSTFNVNSNKKSYLVDLTGNGKKDTLYITTNNNKYTLQVTTEKNNLYVKPTKELNTLGSYYNYWPMQLNLLDISRDKTPEIFIQSSQNNKAIQHIFIYKNNKFKDAFFSYNNVLGFIDCSNNKTPKIISGKIHENNFNFNNYMLIQDKFERYNFEYKDTFMGKDTVLYFIDFLNKLNPNYINPCTDIFAQENIGDCIPIIKKIAESSYNLIFQSANFIDLKSDSHGNPSHIKWVLSFRGNPLTKPNKLCNHTLTLKLRAFKNSQDKYHFKIYSMKLDN